MRPAGLLLALAVAAMAAPSARAQMGGLGGPTTIETRERTALGKLPRTMVDWITEESLRQARSPGDLATLDADMTQAFGDDLGPAARRTRMAAADLVSALRFYVLREAGRLLDEDIRARRKLAGPTPADEEMLAIETAISHRNRVRALEEQAQRRLTGKGKAFID